MCTPEPSCGRSTFRTRTGCCSNSPAGPGLSPRTTYRTSRRPPPTAAPPPNSDHPPSAKPHYREVRNMPRLREVPRAEVTDERILFYYDRLFGPDRDPAVDHGTVHATPGDWWTVFAQSPEVFRHAVRGFAVYRNSRLDPLLRE